MHAHNNRHDKVISRSRLTTPPLSLFDDGTPPLHHYHTTTGRYETVFSRCLLSIPTFVFPAVGMSLPPVVAFCAANPAAALPIATFMTIVSFGLGLPAAVAYFPQTGSLAREELEPELQALLSPHIETVYYNKGL